uniref:PDZ domain-containing protein n=1 Tax=Panagrellus redivivus TaxID=6233 RepID=A0A7E4VPV0_PANRE
MGKRKAPKSTQLDVTPRPPAPEDFNKYITERFGLPKVINNSNYELILVILQKTLTNVLGIQLTDACIVHSVNRDEDGDVMFGDMWLELNGVWIGDKKNFSRIYRDQLREGNGTLKLKLKVCRLNCKQKMDFNRLPMDMLPRREYCYHIALVYGIPGMHLTLGLKAINGKIFVSAITEETLGKMSFAVGDSILEVERQIVVNIGDTYELIKSFLKSQGVVTCVVERADSESANFYVREAIRTEKGNREERMNKDVEKICRRERRRMIREPNLRPTSILRKPKRGHSSRRIKYNSKDTIVDISADINPKLLQPVPSRNIVPIDTILAPGRSAEAILSEISSEMSSMKAESDAGSNRCPRKNRFPPGPRLKKSATSVTGKTTTTTESKILPPGQTPPGSPACNKKMHQVVKRKKKTGTGTITVTATITTTSVESKSKEMVNLAGKSVVTKDATKDMASAPEKSSVTPLSARRNASLRKKPSINTVKTAEATKPDPKPTDTNTNPTTRKSKSKTDSSSSRRRSKPKESSRRGESESRKTKSSHKDSNDTDSRKRKSTKQEKSRSKE